MSADVSDIGPHISYIQYIIFFSVFYTDDVEEPTIFMSLRFGHPPKCDGEGFFMPQQANNKCVNYLGQSLQRSKPWDTCST